MWDNSYSYTRINVENRRPAGVNNLHLADHKVQNVHGKSEGVEETSVADAG